MTIGAITGAYEALLLGYGLSGRMQSDLAQSAEEDRDSLPTGQVKFQIAATYTGFDRIVNSNNGYHTWSIEVSIHAGLTGAALERAFTEGTGTGSLPYLQQTLADKSWWQVAGVFDCTKVDFTKPPTREGNVVSFAVEGIIRTT